MDPLTAALVEALRAALAQPDRRLVFVQLQLVYSDATTQLFSLPGPSVANPVCDPPATRVATDTERAILAVLERAERPLKARTIASRARVLGFSLEYGSHLRRTLAAMVKPEDGRLVYVGRDGYWLAGRELPHTDT
jgi:hypothetical protein